MSAMVIVKRRRTFKRKFVGVVNGGRQRRVSFKCVAQPGELKVGFYFELVSKPPFPPRVCTV